MVTDPPYGKVLDGWPRAFGMDVGWNRTAVIWGARDPSTGVIYLYSEHYRGMGDSLRPMALRSVGGAWIPAVIDPSCLGSSQIDGRALMDLDRELGLNLQPAVNAVEAGITEVWNLLVSGQLKVMASLTNWFRKFKNITATTKDRARSSSATTI